MLRLIPGTLSIALSFLVLAAVFTGIGLTCRRAFGIVVVTFDDVFTDFWMGFAAVILFLILWNFVYAVDGRALVIVLLAGVAGLLSARASLSALLAELRPVLPRWLIVVAVLVVLWVANLSSGGMTNWDTALYHMQSVKWAKEHPVVPGLANLYGSLGFNNSSFLYDAMLDAGPWSGRAWHVANGLLVCMVAVQCMASGARFLTDRGARRATDLFAFLFMASTLNLAMDDRSASFMTDIPRAAVRLVLSVLWYRSLLSERRDERSEAYDVVCIVTLAAVSVAIKMNSAVGSALIVLIATALWVFRTRPRGVLLRRTTLCCVGAGLAFGSAWTARGVVLSGYALFPSTVLAAPVDWRVPTEHAQAEYAYVAHGARATTHNIAYIAGDSTGFRTWFPFWADNLKDDPYYVLVPVVVALFLLPVLFIAWQRSSAGERHATRLAWWILVPNLISLVVWFTVAPEPRYSTSAFWTLAALVGSQAFAMTAQRVNEKQIRGVFAALCVLGISPLVVNPLVEWRSAGADGNLIKAIVHANVRIPPPGEWYQPAGMEPKITPYVTRSGLILNRAVQRCWDEQLPCTPNPAPNLRLRVPGELEKGFTVDGSWQMVDWPNKWTPDFLPAWRQSRATVR